MADAVTTNWDIVKPEVGASSDTWGAKQNTNRDVYDTVFGGVITTTGSANAYVAASGLTAVAYSTQAFRIKANFTNSGAATLNLDGLGAKNIYKQSAAGPVAVASGDIVNGQVYLLAYDGTQFQIVGLPSASFQPLDATLTALAALAWASGNALVQFTAADVVSLTLTPSVSSITASQGAAATTPSATLVNTTDNASVRVARFEGDRANPANSDTTYLSWYLSDSAGNQDEFARLSMLGITVTSGAEDGFFRWSLMKAGTLTAVLDFYHTYFAPATNDVIAIGQPTLGFSDAYFASGAVINFNNGDVTLTHSADALEVAGGTFRYRAPRSTETGGTLTSASANKYVNLATAPTIDGNVFTADDEITLYNNTGSSMTITQGSTGSPTQRLAGTSTTGNLTLAARGCAFVHFVSTTEWFVTGSVS